MTIDDHLRRIREHGYRLSFLQQMGNGNWQAALRRGSVSYLPAICLTAADALDEAFKRSEDGRLFPNVPIVAVKPLKADAPAGPGEDLFG